MDIRALWHKSGGHLRRASASRPLPSINASLVGALSERLQADTLLLDRRDLWDLGIRHLAAR